VHYAIQKKIIKIDSGTVAVGSISA